MCLSGKMKVALMLSGLSRCADVCYPNLYEYLLSKYNVDIYIHSYEETNISLRNSNMFEKQFSQQDLLKLYKPKKIVFEKYNEVRNDIVIKSQQYRSDPTCNPERATSAFRKIALCFGMIEEKYDVYIRSRLDVFHEMPVRLENLDLTSVNIPLPTGKQTRFVDGYYFSYLLDYSGVMDHFAVGGYEPMKKYCSLYDRLDQYCINQGLLFHPETLTKRNLELTGTKLNRFVADYSLHRKEY